MDMQSARIDNHIIKDLFEHEYSIKIDDDQYLVSIFEIDHTISSSEVVYIIYLALKKIGKTLQQSKKWEYDIVSIDNITKYINSNID